MQNQSKYRQYNRYKSSELTRLRADQPRVTRDVIRMLKLVYQRHVKDRSKMVAASHARSDKTHNNSLEETVGSGSMEATNKFKKTKQQKSVVYQVEGQGLSPVKTVYNLGAKQVPQEQTLPFNFANASTRELSTNEVHNVNEIPDVVVGQKTERLWHEEGQTNTSKVIIVRKCKQASIHNQNRAKDYSKTACQPTNYGVYHGQQQEEPHIAKTSKVITISKNDQPPPVRYKTEQPIASSILPPILVSNSHIQSYLRKESSDYKPKNSLKKTNNSKNTNTHFTSEQEEWMRMQPHRTSSMLQLKKGTVLHSVKKQLREEAQKKRHKGIAIISQTHVSKQTNNSLKPSTQLLDSQKKKPVSKSRQEISRKSPVLNRLQQQNQHLLEKLLLKKSRTKRMQNEAKVAIHQQFSQQAKLPESIVLRYSQMNSQFSSQSQSQSMKSTVHRKAPKQFAMDEGWVTKDNEQQFYGLT